MKRPLCLALLGILTSQGVAQTCGPFSLTVVSPDTASFSCSQVGTTTTRGFTPTATSDVNSDGVIECFEDVTQRSRSIGTATLVDAPGSTIELRANVRGSLSTRPVDAGSIVRTGRSSPAHLELIEASDDVGSISVNSIGTVARRVAPLPPRLPQPLLQRLHRRPEGAIRPSA